MISFNPLIAVVLNILKLYELTVVANLAGEPLN
jgi:hypothetical protein